LENIDPSVGIWGLFISAFISSTIAPGGSEVVLAILVSKTNLSPLWLLCVATVGNTLGALTTFGLGVFAAMGYPVEKLSGNYHEQALIAIRRWGVMVLLFSWLPVIGDAFCLAAGWLRLSFSYSLAAILFGKAARYAVVIYTFL